MKVIPLFGERRLGSLAQYSFIADAAGRTATVHLYNSRGKLVAIQTWTFSNSAQKTTDVSGASITGGAVSAKIMAISSGATIFYLQNDEASVTYNAGPPASSNGSRLRVFDEIGDTPLVQRKSERLAVVYGSNLGLLQTPSTGVTTGSRFTTVGIIDSRNYPVRVGEIAIMGLSGSIATIAGMLQLELYQCIDGATLYELNPSDTMAIPVSNSTNFRQVRQVPPGKFAFNVYNQTGANVTNVSVAINWIVE